MNLKEDNIIPIAAIPIPKNQRLASSNKMIASKINNKLNVKAFFIKLFFNWLTSM